MKPILAYIDPGAMTFMIQLVVGMVIAGGAAVTYYIRKVKRKLGSKMNDNQEDYDTIEQIEYDNDDEFDLDKINNENK